MDGAQAMAWTLRWVSPPGWPQPPVGFRADGLWRPDAYWPAAPPFWDFWQVSGDDALVAAYTAETTERDPDPDPVWVPAPGWPTPPAGWMPDPGWRPDPTWPPAPVGWEFWHHPERDAERDLAVEVMTRADRLDQLNDWERCLLVAGRNQVEAETNDSLYSHAAGRLERRRIRQRYLHALDQWRDVCLALRDHLAVCVQRDIEPGPDYFMWRRTATHREQELLAAMNNLSNAYARWLRGLSLRRDIARLSALLEQMEARTFTASGVIAAGEPWQQAEQVAAYALRQFGFLDAAVTRAGADGGIDIRGSGVVAQVKHKGQPVGRPDLQRLVGAADGVRSMFFSAAGYSLQAVEYAEQRGMALFVVQLPNTVLAFNDSAKDILEASRSSAPTPPGQSG